MADSGGLTVPAEAEGDSTSEENSRRERAEFRLLEAEAELKEVVQREKQRTKLRGEAYQYAIGVCAFMGFYLGIVVLIMFSAGAEAFSDQAQIAIFATPILAIATITIFVLRGVFAGFTERGLDQERNALVQMGQSVIPRP